MTVYFCNKGKIDLAAIEVMGVSAKDTDSPIGYFGTGLKYAIAVLLRTGQSVKLHVAGEDAIEFASQRMTVREKLFERVLMGGTPLGFTTELGKNWQIWQAYRELYSNCMDEGGLVTSEEPQDEWDTVFEIAGVDFESVHREKASIFLDTPPAERGGSWADVHRGKTASLFYRGVRVYELAKMSLFTYNLTGEETLTEDRTLKYIGNGLASISLAIVTSKDEDIIAEVVLAEDAYLESDLDFDVIVNPSEEFLNVCERYKSDVRLNLTAARIWEKHRGQKDRFETIELSDFQRTMLNESLKLLGVIGCDIDLSEVDFVKTLGPGCYGLYKDGRIYIAAPALDLGYRFSASTIYEEWVHKTHGYRDASRSMQNFLFERLMAIADELSHQRAAA